MVNDYPLIDKLRQYAARYTNSEAEAASIAEQAFQTLCFDPASIGETNIDHDLMTAVHHIAQERMHSRQDEPRKS